MTAWMAKAMFFAVRTYLGAFAFFAPDFRHARLEHSQIETSLRERTRRLTHQGMAVTRAALQATFEHLPELDPVVLARKTYEDATVPRAGIRNHRWYVARLGTVAAVVATSLILLASLGSGTEPANAWARPGSVTGGERPVPQEEARSLRESLYLATGVCIPADVTAHTLTDELVRNGSPDADCSDLDD